MNTRKATDGSWLTEAGEVNRRNFYREVSGFGDLDALFVEWTDAERQAWEAGHPDEPDDEISDAEALDIITGRAEE